jgi:hypothetical protein
MAYTLTVSLQVPGRADERRLLERSGDARKCIGIRAGTINDKLCVESCRKKQKTQKQHEQ